MALADIARLRLTGFTLVADIIGKFNDSIQHRLLNAMLLATGDPVAVKALLDKGASVHICDRDGSTVLIKAVEGDHAKKIGVLLDRGADINAQDTEGRTALMTAAARGHLGIVQILLDRGADVHLKDRWGMTALQWAEAERHPASIGLLQKAGAEE